MNLSQCENLKKWIQASVVESSPGPEDLNESMASVCRVRALEFACSPCACLGFICFHSPKTRAEGYLVTLNVP